MRTTRINRTDVARIRALTSISRDEFGILVRLLAPLGEDAEHLLAEPVTDKNGRYVDWHVPGVVSAQPLPTLSPEMAADVEARLASITEAIDALADRMELSAAASDRYLARALRNCTTVPEPACIFVVAGRPVLTAWGHVPDHGKGHRSGLSVTAAARLEARVEMDAGSTADPVSSSPPRAAASSRVGRASTPEMPAPETSAAEPAWDRRDNPLLLGALWVLLSILLAAILFRLLKACAFVAWFAWMGLPVECPGGASGPIAETIALEQLARQAEDLERQARQAAAACPPIPVGTTTPNPTDDAAVVSDAEERTAEQNRGDLEITLLWNGTADLDLATLFTCAGQPTVIDFRVKRKIVCGGMLDRDDNFERQVQDPAEHVVWTDAASVPNGPMQIVVSLYRPNAEGARPIPFQVVVRRGSEPPAVFRGTADPTRSGWKQIVTTIEN